ncbi:MAG: chemotaxis protein CheW [Gemmatimonadales bacterium]
MVSLVAFRVGRMRCGLPVAQITEIVPSAPATRVPGAVPVVNGLVNVRGRLLTVADGRRILNQADAEPVEEPAILVLEVGGRPLGLVVDEVYDLLHVPEEAMEERGALPGVDPRIVRAVARVADDVVVVLEADVIFAPVFA